MSVELLKTFTEELAQLKHRGHVLNLSRLQTKAQLRDIEDSQAHNAGEQHRLARVIEKMEIALREKKPETPGSEATPAKKP